MERDFKTVSPDISVRELIEEHVIGTSRRVFPVVDQDRLQGLVCLADLGKVARERQVETRVAEIMTPAKELKTLAPDDKASTAMERLSEHGVNQIPIVEDGRVVGLVSREDILTWLALRRGAKTGLDELRRQ
jgi:CBS domain-containing protein